jgi:formylglycine-generating enzyme required for sulfatase activity
MPHIFISYAKKDTRPLAISLEEAFNALDGVTAWVDKSMRAGQSWEIQIQKEILRCDFMVVLYSPDINRHLYDDNAPESYVLTEISYAKYTAKKRIIPVMAQRTDAPMSLTMEHYIDYVGMGLSLDDLVDALCFEMGIANQSGGTKMPQPPQIVTSTKPKIVLPEPFDWCYIPEGQVTFGPEDGSDNDFYAKKKMTVDAPAFWMAKYPVTNKQYREFVNDGGDKPTYWLDKEWNGNDYPVVGVTWYEVRSFCDWLSNKTGEKIMLPSDVMWQRAAQGDDGRKFPWGNTWDASLCNNNVDEKGVGKTTPVRQYEAKYPHPFGLVDMSGNISEWCLTTYKTGSNRIGKNDDLRVQMGGGWGTKGIERFTCAFRYKFLPIHSSKNWGFRVACYI